MSQWSRRSRGSRRTVRVLVLATLVAAVGCGSGDGMIPVPGGADGPADNMGDDRGDEWSDAFGAPDQVDVAALGAPPEAGPGTAVAVVEGQRMQWEVAGSLNPACEVSPDRVQVRLDADGTGTIEFQMSLVDDRWQGSGAFTHPEADHTDLYVAESHVTVTPPTITYQGPMVRRRDYGHVELQDHLGSFTVDCGSAGGDPVAVVGDDTYTFPVLGSRHFECEYSPERFAYRVDLYAPADPEYPSERLDVEARLDGDRWIGHVVVGIGADRYHSFVAEDLAGMEVGPDQMTWSGTFTHTNQRDDTVEETVAGSVSIEC